MVIRRALFCGPVRARESGRLFRPLSPSIVIRMLCADFLPAQGQGPNVPLMECETPAPEMTTFV